MLKRWLARATRTDGGTPTRVGGDLAYVETAHRVGPHLILSGWTTADALALHDAATGTSFEVVDRTGRDDVRAFARDQGVADPSRRPAFVAVAETPTTPARVTATVGPARGSLPMPTPGPLTAALTERLVEAGFDADLLARVPDDDPPGEAAPTVNRGHVDTVLASPVDGAAVVAGWAVLRPGAVLRIETTDGVVVDADRIVRHPRPDVVQAMGLPASLEPGLLAYLPPAKPGRSRTVRVVATEGATARTLASHSAATALPGDAIGASRALFDLPGRDTAFRDRALLVDLPLLQPMIAAQARSAEAAPLRETRWGTPPSDPEVTLVVPLYGRADFVEHQMSEMARDPWLRARADLLYVIDDPALVEAAQDRARRAERLWGMPARTVWTGRTGGYSVANNIGAAQARTRRLLFMNSDVVPTAPGWLERMCATLDGTPGVGAVGARLLYASGGLQHGGMAFARNARLGIWTNRHPGAGLAPADAGLPEDAPYEVDAATGACLLVGRREFDAVGGWDSGYLIGDFEDSDLCLSLRDRGHRVVVEPRATLVHLERQSIGQGEAAGARLRTTLLNAARHESRWRDLIARRAALRDAEETA